MTVHIDELHSDVVAAPPAAAEAPGGDAREEPWAAQARAVEAVRRADWLAHRVRAVDFDD